MAVLGLDPRINPAIAIGWLLTGIASFVRPVQVEMTQSSPTITALESLR
jgi:hypothetical protein